MIDCALFNALQNIDVDNLSCHDISQVLPYMANLLLNSSFVKRPQLLRILYRIRKMNDMIQLMSFKSIEQLDYAGLESLSFESCTYVDKMRFVAAEYIRIHDQTRQAINTSNIQQTIKSDLFDNDIYVDDVSNCLCTLIMKSMNYNIADMSEVLLHVKYGTTYIVRLVANMPERCLEICNSLISLGDRLDELSTHNEVPERRAKTVRMLCLMNPSIAHTIRLSTLQLGKLPSLTIMITLDQLTHCLERYNKSNDDQSLRELRDCYDGALAFITGVFLDSDESTRTWFAQSIKNVQLKRIDHNLPSVLSNLRSQLIVCMSILFREIVDDGEPLPEVQILNRSLIRATGTLRLYCALRGMGSIKLNTEEVDILLRLITIRSTVVNPTVINYTITGVCTLLVCAGLVSNQKDEKKVADWLKWIIKESNYSDIRYSRQGKCSISELLLLVAIHFLNNQSSQIADLVCATLSMKLTIKTSVTRCKTLFVQEVFNDQMVTEHAVRVPVTKNLSNDITEFLPVHCIHQLLESRSFSKHQVPISDWIYNQICESSRPVHNIMPKLIDAYVSSVTASWAQSSPNSEPIPEDELIRIFSHQLYTDNQFVEAESNYLSVDKSSKDHHLADIEVAQVLFLYYILLYEEQLLKKIPDGCDRSKLVRYSPDFLMEIPVFYLLQRVRNDQNSYGVIFPELIKLVTSQFPQLCSIQHWMSLEHNDETNAIMSTINMKTSINKKLDLNLRLATKINNRSTKEATQNIHQQLLECFRMETFDISQLTRILNQILQFDRENIWPFARPFIDNLPRLLGLNVGIENTQDYRALMNCVNKLWWRLNNIFPRKLWVMTVNALKRTQDNIFELRSLEHSWDELVLDPLITLRCDARVFRCATLLNITLNILNAFLAASRRCLQDHMYEQPRQIDLRSLEELRHTLIHAQTSAAIQILLEYCLPREDEQLYLKLRELESNAFSNNYAQQQQDCGLNPEQEYILARFDASVNCVCEHLHQVFIADTNLAKLVHFQTYPSELLSTTSDKIPSMHICLDFIPELLSQPDITKQVFVIELTSHLCEKYAITKSLNVAKLCFNVSFTMLQLLNSERRALFFIPVLPALLRICNVFPILRDDAEIVLAQIDQVSRAHMASTSSRLSLGAAKPFDGLEKLSWREAKKMMASLSLNEALHMCIQKSIAQLRSSNMHSTNIGAITNY